MIIAIVLLVAFGQCQNYYSTSSSYKYPPTTYKISTFSNWNTPTYQRWSSPNSTPQIQNNYNGALVNTNYVKGTPN